MTQRRSCSVETQVALANPTPHTVALFDGPMYVDKHNVMGRGVAALTSRDAPQTETTAERHDATATERQ